MQRATGSHWTARLHQVTQQVGLSSARGALLAFADYNSDNFVDLFLAAEGEGGGSPRQLQVYTWRGDAHSGRFEQKLRWNVSGLLGLIPGDFDGDGQLDAIAMVEHSSCAHAGAISFLECNRTFGCAAAPARATIRPTAASQPLALDFNGDMRTDLLGAYRDFGGSPRNCTQRLHEPCSLNMSEAHCCSCGLQCTGGGHEGGHERGGPASGTCNFGGVAEPLTWTNSWEGASGFSPIRPFESGASPFLETSPPGLQRLPPTAPPDPPSAPSPPSDPAVPTGGSPYRPAVPNSNANVDLNGDCRADIALVALPAEAPPSTLGCEAVACQLLIWLQQPDGPGPVDTSDTAPPIEVDPASGDDAPLSPPPGTPPSPPPPPITDRWLPTPSHNLTLPVGASQISFTDLDADGLIDLVFVAPPAIAGGNFTVHAWYAMLATPSAFATSWVHSSCVPPPRNSKLAGRLCVFDPLEELVFFKRAFTLPAGWRLGSGSTDGLDGGYAAAAALPHRPPTLSVADFFLDGFPEALLPLVAPDTWAGIVDTHGGCEAGQPCLVLLHNDEDLRCQASSFLDVFPAEEPSPSSPIPSGAEGGPRIFPLLAHVSSGAFFDLYEDGLWDILASHTNGSLAAWRQPAGGLDNYFLKVVTSDGACAPAPVDGKLVLPEMPSFDAPSPPPPLPEPPPGPPPLGPDSKASWKAAAAAPMAEVAMGAAVVVASEATTLAMRGEQAEARRQAQQQPGEVVQTRPRPRGDAQRAGSTSAAEPTRAQSSSVGARAASRAEADAGAAGEERQGLYVGEERDDRDAETNGDGTVGTDSEEGGLGMVNTSQPQREGSLRDSSDRCVRAQANDLTGYMAGVNQPGVSYQFLTTLPTQWNLMDTAQGWAINRPKQRRAAAQLAQSAYAPLLAPYVLVGLGQTHDYVSEVSCAHREGAQVRGTRAAAASQPPIPQAVRPLWRCMRAWPRLVAVHAGVAMWLIWRQHWLVRFC